MSASKPLSCPRSYTGFNSDAAPDGECRQGTTGSSSGRRTAVKKLRPRLKVLNVVLQTNPRTYTPEPCTVPQLQLCQSGSEGLAAGMSPGWTLAVSHTHAHT